MGAKAFRSIISGEPATRSPVGLEAGPAHGTATLPVLRTTLRQLAYVGLRCFDVWALGASAEDLEHANDVFKPVLDALMHLRLPEES